MRIVFSTDTFWPRVNGVAVSVDTFRRELIAMGHDVLILAPEYLELPSPARTGTTQQTAGIVRLPSRSLFFSTEDKLIDVQRAQKTAIDALKAFQPDILHAHTEFSGLEILLEYRRKHKLPLVMTSHTYWERYIKVYLPFLPSLAARRAAIAVTRMRFRKANLIIVPSQSMKSVLQSYKIRKPITVIPTGISSDDFNGIDRDQLRKTVPWLRDRSSDTKILTFIGRLSQEKNPFFMLPVIEEIRQQHPNILLLFVGDGPCRKELEYHVHKRGLQGNIQFLGYLPRTELRQIYGTTDVFTFPSKTETQGLVTIESMICGTPVVAIGQMGTREVMNGDNGGYMVEDNQEQFTERVLRLLNDPDLWQRKSAEALQYARNWTSQAMAQRLLDAYKDLSGRH